MCQLQLPARFHFDRCGAAHACQRYKTAQGLLVKEVKRQRITSHDSCFGLSKSLFERLEADMNLPLSNAVNPALASALLTVSSPAPALSSTAGSAASLRDDFAQHFARMARQNQARPPLGEPAPHLQSLLAEHIQKHKLVNSQLIPRTSSSRAI